MQAAQGAKKQILVVEDEGLIADDIQRRLERLGYAVPAIATRVKRRCVLRGARPSTWW